MNETCAECGEPIPARRAAHNALFCSPKCQVRCRNRRMRKLTKSLKRQRQAGRKTSRRTCLGCNGEFDSTGPGNRLCDGCNALNQQFGVKASPVRSPNEAEKLLSVLEV